MTIADPFATAPDPDEYTPEPGPVTAAQEYSPEGDLDNATREADPADVADQLVEFPVSDDDGPTDDGQFD